MFHPMQLAVLLIIASTASLSAATWHDGGHLLGGQLNNFTSIYSSLSGGLRVRYFIDLQQCQLISGKQYPAPGDEITSYTATVRISSTSFVSFSSQILNYLSGKMATTLAETQVYSDQSVIVTMSTIDPATFQVSDRSQFMCNINDGSKGSANFYSPAPGPPSILGNFSSIAKTVEAGFTVLYSVDYGKCNPVPVINITRGGTISPYQATTTPTSNPGLQLSEVRLTAVGYDTMIMSFFQNGSVNFDLRVLNGKYQPIATQYASCMINDGMNKGGVTFY